MISIGIVIGSTRPGRKAEVVARWVHDIAGKRDDAKAELVDLKDFNLPHLDEVLPPAIGVVTQTHTRRWAARIASFDAFVFVTPEYNRSIPGALKNAIDYLYKEWANKSAGFVSYGVYGGVTAIEHLRSILGQVGVADVRAQVALSLATDFVDMKDFRPAPQREKEVMEMLDQTVAWGRALRTLRQE